MANDVLSIYITLYFFIRMTGADNRAAAIRGRNIIMTEKRRRRFGDRKDGWKIRGIEPMAKVSPYIMVKRNDACNLILDELDIDPIEKYIHDKRAEGLDRFGIMHVIVAAYVRGISQRPAINRFIAGQKIYARNNIEVNLTIKKEFTLDAPDTVIKIELEPDMTAQDVYERFEAAIRESRGEESNFDNTAKFLNYIPGVLMKFTMYMINMFDYFGLLPRKLTRVSPFHGTLFITSMGSLGIPPVFHHLYNFGNIPVFCAFGSKERRYELQKDGSVRQRRFIKWTFVTDERICDGFYFASALKLVKGFLKTPHCLDNPPEVVARDIE